MEKIKALIFSFWHSLDCKIIISLSLLLGGSYFALYSQNMQRDLSVPYGRSFDLRLVAEKGRDGLTAGVVSEARHSGAAPPAGWACFECTSDVNELPESAVWRISAYESEVLVSEYPNHALKTRTGAGCIKEVRAFECPIGRESKKVQTAILIRFDTRTAELIREMSQRCMGRCLAVLVNGKIVDGMEVVSEMGKELGIPVGPPVDISTRKGRMLSGVYRSEADRLCEALKQ